ncbi:MAG: FAD-dependent oxidoreductase [Flavobacteriaceae bacterium]|nr:FAD-dependent oxidoreductase [Flavobacteriaceae bacterium]
MLDYIVVGLGLAGISFCEQLERNGKSFVVFEDQSQFSSQVAGGLYNPVILKRFTLAWEAKPQFDKAIPFYAEIESKLQTRVDEKIAVHRKFSSIEEQNNWFLAADKPGLSEFLDVTIKSNHNDALLADHGLGEVKFTGRILVKKLIREYKCYLNERYKAESFDHDDLGIKNDFVNYKGLKSRKIVFCEGFGLKQNPFFNFLPLNGTKGELLTIKAPDLKLEKVLKSSVFLIPLGEDLYTVGATYNWDDKTNSTTEEAKVELLEKLATLIQCDYEIVKQSAGIRPTVIDRRPLVGSHPNHPHLAVLNGLGTRGVMLAPTISEALYDYLENDIPLNIEIDIKRFQ